MHKGEASCLFVCYLSCRDFALPCFFFFFFVLRGGRAGSFVDIRLLCYCCCTSFTYTCKASSDAAKVEASWYTQSVLRSKRPTLIVKWMHDLAVAFSPISIHA